MASSLNSDNGVVSGSAGLKSSADSTGVLELQTNGTAALSISTAQVVSTTNGVTLQGLTVGRGAGAVSSNTALGSGALSNASTTGGFNTALGRNTLVTLTSGEENTAVGNSVLNLATTGGSNVGVGNASLAATTTGGSNVAVGFGSLQKNTTGSNSTVVGYQAGYNNTTATNIAIGYQALYTNSTLSGNVAVGYSALYSNVGSNNTAVGHFAAYTKSSGGSVTAFGRYASYSETSGSDNTSVGTNALFATTSGSSNVAVGASALTSNTTASNNTAVGYQAGTANTTGAQQTLIGYRAGASLTLTGADHNTAVGYNALTAATGSACEVNTAIGSTSLLNLTSGLGNTALGYGSGVGLTTGVRCTFIGRSAVGNNANAQEEIVISAGPCTGQGDNYVTIGKNGAKIYNKYDTNATWTYTSDGRLKQNITADSLGLSFINRLRTVTYQWKPSNEVPSDMPQYGEVNTRNITTVMHGLIAQEVKAALDAEGVTTFAGWDQGPDGVQAVSREMFITPLIKAVQELTAQVESLKARLDAANL